MPPWPGVTPFICRGRSVLSSCAHKWSHCWLGAKDSEFARNRGKERMRQDKVWVGSPIQLFLYPKLQSLNHLNGVSISENLAPLWPKGLCWTPPFSPPAPSFSLLRYLCAPGGWTSVDGINQALLPFGFPLLSANGRQWWKAYRRRWKGSRRELFGYLFYKLLLVGLEPGGVWVPLSTATSLVAWSFLLQQHSPGSLNHSVFLPMFLPRLYSDFGKHAFHHTLLKYHFCMYRLFCPGPWANPPSQIHPPRQWIRCWLWTTSWSGKGD